MPSISRLLSHLIPCFRQSPPRTPPGRSRPSDDGPVTLSDRLAPLKEEWPAADCAASARMKTLNQRTAMPTATQQLLHAMHLHLALRATVRRGGSESGPPPPDLTRAITQAAAALTQTERRALQPHLAEPQGWLEWSRSQLLRRGDKAAVARKQGALVETDAQRLLQSLRDALRSPAPRDGTRISARAAQIDDPDDVHQQLRKAAAEIRTSGHWTGAGGDLAPHLVTTMPGWPEGLSLRIEDKAGIRAPMEFGQSAPGRTPVTVQIDHVRHHYSPIVDGRPRDVPAKGDCFYESVLRAMRVKDQRALFKGMRFQKGAGMGDLIRAMRRQVADELERQIERPGGPPDELCAQVIARWERADLRALPERRASHGLTQGFR